MLTRLFTKPLSLNIAEQPLTFNSLADFEFALNCRTEVPGAKVSALVQLTTDALAHEAKSIRQVERVFVDVLAKSLEDPSAVGALLDSIDLQSFSSDHQWREIIVALRPQGKAYDQYKQAAIVRYMQYLTARQEVLRSIYLNKKKFESHAPERDDDCEPDLRDTQIIDVRRTRDADFVQLPRGETIEVQCATHNELPIMLSKYRFRIVNDGGLRLVSDDGNEFNLGIGKNVVGRYGGNNVALDPGYRDISRKHLVVERVDEDTLRLTDLSAHGTFVPATVLQMRRQ